MTYREFVIVFEKLKKTKPVKQIAIDWGIMPGHLTYYRDKAKVDPDAELPAHIERKIK